jgi:DNA-binding CsgD family transcriptional regulator
MPIYTKQISINLSGLTPTQFDLFLLSKLPPWEIAKKLGLETSTVTIAEWLPGEKEPTFYLN